MRRSIRFICGFAIPFLVGATNAEQTPVVGKPRIEVVPNTGQANDPTYGVKSVAYSPDGRTLVTGGADEVIVWDARNGRQLRTLLGHRFVEQVSFSPDGRLILSAAWDNTAKLWDPETGTLLRTLKAETAKMNTAVFSPDGRLIATGGYENAIKLSDAATGSLVRSIKVPSYIESLVFLPDGKTIVAGGQDKVVRLFDLASGRQTRAFAGHTDAVELVAASRDSQTIASVDRTSIKLWNAKTGTSLGSIMPPGGPGRFTVLTFSPDGGTLYYSNHTDLRSWDIAKAREIRSWPANASSGALSADGRFFAAGGSHNVTVWDLESGNHLPTPLETSGDFNPKIAFSPDGKTIAVGGWGDKVSLWDSATARPLDTLVKDGNRLAIEAMAFSPNGATLAAVTDEGSLHLWNAADRRFQRTIPVSAKTLRSISFSPIGAGLILAGEDNRIRFWDSVAWRELRTISTTAKTESARWSPDGRFIIAYYPDLALIDATTGREVSFKTPMVLSAALSPDGRSVVVGNNYDRNFNGFPETGLELMDGSNGGLARRLSGHGSAVNAVAFSRDGRLIFSSGGRDKTLKIWDATNGQLRHTLIGHSGDGIVFAISPDERTIVSSSTDRTIRRWNLSGELLATSLMSENGEWLTITPEGFFDASAAGAGLVNIVRGLDAYAVDQFYQSLYRPDLVREKLAGDPRGLVQEAAASLDLTKAITSGNAPDVRLTLPGRGLGAGTVDGNGVSAEAEIIDRGGGIGRVEWRINGLTVGIDDTAPAAAGQRARLTRRLVLNPGGNAIEVVAYNAANLIASTPAHLDVAARVPSPSIQPSLQQAAPVLVEAAKPRLFGLVAGVNDYADKRIKLSYAVSDAREVARGLKEAAASLYQSVDVRLMTDAEVTREKLDTAFAQVMGQAQPSDVFVLYLAGHGKTVDGRYYFIPQDFAIDGELNDTNVNAAVKSKAITQEQLQRWFAQVPARRSVVLFDTCDSGTLTGDAGETQLLEKGAANDRLAQATGRSIITASGGSQEALEGYHNHGLFTYELLDALNRADGDHNGTIEVTELAAYVYAEVSELSLKVFKQRQAPQMKITANYPLTKQTRILHEDTAQVSEAKPAYQVTQTAQLQIKPSPGATVVRSLSAKTPVSVLESKDGWSLVASEGKPIGYVATRDLTPLP